jgi:hypothetical protein
MGRLFTGQGPRDHFIAALELINKYRDKFKAAPALKKYFAKDDFLQEMLDDACMGLDCVGFVGTYMVEAGLESGFERRVPLGYAVPFPLVKKLDDVQSGSVVMLTSGLHIQLVDVVTDRGSDYIKVDLCQSTEGGPQCNVGVVIKSGGGDYLPVEQFRAARDSNSKEAEWKEDNKKRGKERNYETYLRAIMTEHNHKTGYLGGAIFNSTSTGNPPNPIGVSGSVYIGCVPGGLSYGWPGNDGT